MRGTVKQGGGGAGGGVKDEGGGGVKTGGAGGRRNKANHAHATPIPTANIKQEAGAEVKPDPDAATGNAAPCLNGDDSAAKTTAACPGNNNNTTNANNNNNGGGGAKVRTQDSRRRHFASRRTGNAKSIYLSIYFLNVCFGLNVE